MVVDRTTLALSDLEVEEFLSSRFWTRLATVSGEGEPHVTPVGYVWYEGRAYFQSLRRSKRARNLEENDRVSLCVDEGVGATDSYTDRCGVVVSGRCRPLRDDEGHLRAVVGRLFAQRMFGDPDADIDRSSHDWYVVEPTRLASWDFGRIPPGADRMLGTAACGPSSER